MGQTNGILALVVIVLLILTGIFFPMERPYWYISILTLILAVLIILVKIIWGVATWSDNQFRRHFGD